MRLAVAIGSIVVLCGLARADAPPPALADAIKAAAAAHQPLLVEFGATWCGPCKELEQHILPDPRVQSVIHGVMFVRYDIDVEPGAAAAQKLRVESYPTFIAIDKSGTERLRRSGVQTGDAGVSQFVALVGAARLAVQDEADVLAGLRAHPDDAATALEAARWYAAHDRTPQAVTHYDAVAANPAALRAQKLEATRAVPRLHRVEQWKQQLVAEKLDLIRKDPALATADDLAIATIGEPANGKVVASVLAAQTDIDTLNSLIYVALAANAKDEALAAATQMIAKHRDAEHLDTLAECHHARGDRAGALKLEAEALALAKGTSVAPILTKNQARFAAGTADSDDVLTLRARIADLWKRLAAVDQLTDRPSAPAAPSSSPASPQPNVSAFLDARKATHDLSLAIARTCTTVRGKAQLADVRLDLADTGAITASVVLLEADAPPALRACIAKQLAAAKLPAPPAELHRQLLQIDFTELK